MNAPITTEREFLFVIDIRNELYYHNPGRLQEFLDTIPESIRIYSIIHAGMHNVKIYGVTSNYSDYEMVSEMKSIETEIIDTHKESS